MKYILMIIPLRFPKYLLVLAVLLTLPVVISAASGPPERVKVAFYNVENLYDTIPSLFYDDGDYTPGGRYRWDTEKYTAKLNNLKRVLDEMSADVVGLAEVENEGVVRDLVGILGDDYNYIHRTGSDRRGIDPALLYKGDVFVPLGSRLVSIGSSREALHVQGELAGCAVDVVVCHLPSQLNTRQHRHEVLAELYSFVDSLHIIRPDARVILAGDFNSAPSEKIMRRTFGTGGRPYDLSRPVYSPFGPLARKGMGTYAYNGSWRLYDNIFISTSFLAGPLRYSDCGIFIRDWMLTQDGTRNALYPLRTFTAGRYSGGFSDHLPVYIIFDVITD